MRNCKHSLGEKVQKSVQNCVISVQKKLLFNKKFYGGKPPDSQLERGIAPPQTPPLRSSKYPPHFSARSDATADGQRHTKRATASCNVM